MSAIMGGFSGVPLNNVVLSVNSAHRVRKNHCQDVADDALNAFSEQAKVTEAPLVVHFDGEKSFQVYQMTFHFQVRSSLLTWTAGRRRWTGS